MNLFLAAVYKNDYTKGRRNYVSAMNEVERSVVDALPHFLESYHYICSQKYVDEIRSVGGKVFLDSGAFSAYSLGVDIDINAYCDYIIRNKDIIMVDDGAVMASVLDGIGDPQKTWENQSYMERAGVVPLPCFHFGEDNRYLEYYIKNYPYITIGGMVGKKAEDLTKWLDYIWEKFLLDGRGKPRLKVHAFGITSERIMERYPWWSVDSSSWIQAASFGNVFASGHRIIAISSKSLCRHDEGRHISTLTAIERAELEREFIESGFEHARLAEVYQSRAAFNMLSFMKLNARLNQKYIDTGGELDCHKIQQLF